MHLQKYEWVGSPDVGDCSLWVREATLEFDDGLWQCQVTASDFTTQDALASEPARLVVRGKLSPEMLKKAQEFIKISKFSLIDYASPGFSGS